MTDWWLEERAARKRGFRIIAGIDEAGRGPLAGPVVAACVVLPFEANLPDVRDSKELTESQREAALAQIEACALGIGIGAADVETIDSVNILRATHCAMKEAVESLAVVPDVALIDGLPVQPFPLPQIALVGGDARSLSVAAASIVAKVTRDRMMRAYDAEFPEYGFASHKGYATPEHLSRLREHGPCRLHRRSFAPVAELLCQEALPLEESAIQRTGKSGEAIAASYLQAQGIEILAARYSCRGGEIDLIGREDGALIFVEVKARHGRAFGEPAESVDRRKRARMTTAAEAYLFERGCDEVLCRFDVVEVRMSSSGLSTVNHIRNAFAAGE